MLNRHESRRSIRLRVTDGLVILFVPGRVPLACAIADISHSGCCVRLSEGLLHESQIEEWRELLLPGRRIECELHKPPYIQQLAVHAAVCHTGSPSPTALDVGLAFVDIDSEFSAIMDKAMPELARVKPSMHPAPAVSAPSATTTIPDSTATKDQSNLSGQPIEVVLVNLGLMTAEAAASAQREAQRKKTLLHRYLLQNHLAGTAALCNALALSSGLPVTDLDLIEISLDVAKRFSYLLMMRYEFIPFAESDDTFWLAAAAPISVAATTELMRICGKQVLVFLSPANQISARLFRLRPRPPYQERAHVRLRAALPANYELCGEYGIPPDELHFDGVTENISETGLSIFGPPHPTLALSDVIDQAPLLRVNLSTPRGDVHALCRIRHLELQENETTPGLSWHFGTEILEIADDEAELLRRVCIEMGIDRMRERGKNY